VDFLMSLKQGFTRLDAQQFQLTQH
jgi:hypothetical protein